MRTAIDGTKVGYVYSCSLPTRPLFLPLRNQYLLEYMTSEVKSEMLLSHFLQKYAVCVVCYGSLISL